ncbi:MAG TPA: M20/M25/M40 family metallo-hydrolase [Phycisphaerales bacterium]|nr:M20/M25/M40 family metallo-hydrolase [Phycisphaerales bacterium]
MNTDLLKRLCETPGVPGREERVRALIKKEVEDLFDDITTDPMGSLICRRAPRGKGNSKSKSSAKATRVMLACHMDEIGFYVTHIDDNGFIRLNPAGGFDTRNLFARRVLVCTKDDGMLLGVMNPGGRPIHIATEEDKKKIPEVRDFFVDLGLPAAKVKRMVRVGDMVVLHEPFAEVGEKLVSKALDNRIACWLGIEAVRALDKSKSGHNCEIFSVFTTQEEVGLRGAKTASATVQPDIGIGLDTTLACDTPGIAKEESVTTHGQGCGLHVMDGSFISDYQLIDELEEVARKHRIKHQRTILARGGQDGAAMQQTLKGCRAAGIVVGVRYIHTVTEMCDRGDLQAACDLLAAWLPTVK